MLIFMCAPGRIRTCVAHRAPDLQSGTIDHSVTDAIFNQLREYRRGYSLLLEIGRAFRSSP